MSEKCQFIDAEKDLSTEMGEKNGHREDVLVVGCVEVGVLRVARPARFGDGAAAGLSRDAGEGGVRRVRRDLRPPACARPAGPPGRGVYARAVPRHHA